MAELVFMSESRQRMQWEPMSHMMTLFANINRNPKKKAFKFSDFFPFHIYEKRDYESIPKADITDLKKIFSNEKDINWDKK